MYWSSISDRYRGAWRLGIVSVMGIIRFLGVCVQNRQVSSCKSFPEVSRRYNYPVPILRYGTYQVRSFLVNRAETPLSCHLFMP